MATGVGTIEVKGQKELARAFKNLRKEVVAEIKPELLRIGEIVRVDAERRAIQEITNIGDSWGRMRIGATVNGVYVAPKTRNRGGSPRPNMAGLLMSQAMEPAVEAHSDRLHAELEALVTVTAVKNGFTVI